MQTEFGGQILGNARLAGASYWLVMVEHDGTRFFTMVCAENRAHAVAVLAVAASARFHYRVLSVEACEHDFFSQLALDEIGAGEVSQHDPDEFH